MNALADVEGCAPQAINCMMGAQLFRSNFDFITKTSCKSVTHKALFYEHVLTGTIDLPTHVGFTISKVKGQFFVLNLTEVATWDSQLLRLIEHSPIHLLL